MKKIFVVLLILALCVMPISSVRAAESQLPDQPEPIVLETSVQEYSTIPIEQRPARAEIFSDFEDLSNNTGDVSILASGCKLYTQGVKMYNAFGGLLWEYSWTINWCYDGVKITSLQKTRYVWTTIGWSFQGDIEHDQQGGVGKTSYWHYVQGHMCLVEQFSCAINQYPWVKQTVFGNGAAVGDSGY